jgi:hypothetical protein
VVRHHQDLTLDSYVDYRDEPAHMAAWRASVQSALCIEAGWRESMTDTNPQNMNVPDRPTSTPLDKRINPAPTDRERADREADKLAHKGAEREHEFDNLQKPFTK